MKKRLYLSLMLIFLLSGCDIITELTCEHSYEVTSSVPSTCSKAGHTISTCSKCGKEKKTSLPVSEHSYSQSYVAATCSNEGYTLNVCDFCGYEKKSDIVVSLPHTYTEITTESTCEDKGYTTYSCTVCGYSEKGNYVNALGHDLSDWEITKEPTDVTDGEKVRECSRCDYNEKEYIMSKSYIDLTYIRDVYDSTKVYNCNNYDELSYIYNLAVVNLADTLTCNVYEFSSFDNLLDDLVNDCDAPYSYSVAANLVDNVLTLSFVYYGIPNTKTNSIAYVQYSSVNYNPNTNKRNSNYDSFKINDSLYTFNVKTSDQLHYALERGAKPIIEKNSSVEALYKKIKDVLKEIINDDMTDYEKVVAIHDWLVMNVVYDDALLRLASSNSSNLKKYNGFYLEGVFLDNKAVCEGISKAFTVMCNIEGIPCVTVEGIQADNPNGVGHAWNKVYIDGKWYIVDTTSDGTIIGNQFEVLSYKYFLVSEEEYSKDYIGTNRTNIVCNNKVDVYESMTFTYKDNVYDYVIENQEELNALVAYFYAGQSSNCTIEFELKFNYGDSILDEIQTAFNVNKLNMGYTYVDNGNIFMLIK